MTPSLARFMAESQAETPCVALDLDVVAARYDAFRRALPEARVFYAVKANPAPAVLARLASMGCSFDAASIEEIRACIAAGAAPMNVSFGNTVKRAASIAEAYRLGVDLFAFDSVGELGKIAREAPGARVYCRILVGNDGAEWPLSRKFGCEPDMAVDLMSRAAGMGLVPHGISFHVGSQQTSPSAWGPAMARAADVSARLRDLGVRIAMLNVGGGFPARYREPVPGIADYAGFIRSSLAAHFGPHIPEIMAEPGRHLVAEAGVLLSEVVLVSRKSADEDARWVYLDIGRFGGLAETEGEAIRYDILPLRQGAPTGPVVIAGPTCDSVDTLYQRSSYELPLDLEPGDRLAILCTGAYVTTYASQGFNGFRPPNEVFL